MYIHVFVYKHMCIFMNVIIIEGKVINLRGSEKALEKLEGSEE